MRCCVEPLEPRALFTASYDTTMADQNRVSTDLGAVRAASSASAPAVRADVATVATDVSALPATAANHRLAAKLNGDASRLSAAVAAADRRIDAALGLPRGFNGVVMVRLGQTKADLRRGLVAGTVQLHAGTTGPVAKLQSLLRTAPATFSADAAALVAANPSDTTFANDAAKAGSDLSAEATTVGPELRQAEADLTTVLADLRPSPSPIVHG